MSEKKLIGFLSIEGVLLLILGLCILILPKLTTMSFIITLAVALIIYGVFKFVSSFIKRVPKIFACEMLLGIYLTVVGILLCLVPKINLYWMIALIAIYLLFESIVASSYIAHLKNVLRMWHLKCPVVLVMILAALAILVKLPNIAIATVAVIVGICYVLKGMDKIILSKINGIDALNHTERETIETCCFNNDKKC